MKATTLEKKLESAELMFAAGEMDRALKAYRYLVQKLPRDPRVLLGYGRISLAFGELQTTEAVWQALTKHYPSNSDVLLSIGHTCETCRFPDMAQKYFEAAAEADKTGINPRISLALLHEKGRRLGASRVAIQECLQINTKDEQARYLSAFLDFREDKLEAAEVCLRDLIATNPRHEYVYYASRYVLAEILDRTNRFDEAMRVLDEAKAFVRNLPYTIALSKKRPAADLQGAVEAFKQFPRDISARLDQEFPVQIRSEIHRYAFLGGHPRSGTTLLEQILGTHPEIVAVDEPDLDWLCRGATQPGVTVSRLNLIRRRYMKFLTKAATGPLSPGKLVLEKNPHATTTLPLLLRLFPELRVLIALRDPRDVVLSLYFQNIPLNHVRFFSLEDFAKSYAFMMGIWLTMRDWVGFSWMETRYEDTVADTEKEGRRVTEFLGLNWHENQVRFFDAARQRRVYAPTYHDVTKPIYTRSVGRWRNYEKYFEPVLPILEPFCRSFGYSS